LWKKKLKKKKEEAEKEKHELWMKSLEIKPSAF
jgi:hypothetical protein